MAKSWWEEVGDALGTSQGTGISISDSLNFNRAVGRGDHDTANSLLGGANLASSFALDKAVTERKVPGGLDWSFLDVERK